MKVQQEEVLTSNGTAGSAARFVVVLQTFKFSAFPTSKSFLRLSSAWVISLISAYAFLHVFMCLWFALSYSVFSL